MRGFAPADLPREIASGITLAALVTPLNIGYAQVAGLPPVMGLYAAMIPLTVYALFTASRHVIAGPDASAGALIGAALLGFAAPGEALRGEYALALAIVCGLLFVAFWLLRLAFLANFLSRAVLAGFVTGVAVEVFTNQVRKILAAPHGGGSGLEDAAHQLHDAMFTSFDTTGYFLEVIALVESIPHANLYSLGIGLGSLVIVRLMKRYAPKVPGALVALTLMTVIVALFGLDQKGVSVLGEVPSGLPTFTVPDIPLAEYLRLVPGSIAIVAIVLCESLLLTRRYSRLHGYRADGNQVLFAFGIANISAGFSGAFFSGSSPSRSAAMDASGARSQFPSIVAAVTIALIMLMFTDVLAFLPNAALAGIVANAVLSLIGVGELRELWRMRRTEFWIAMICFISVLALGPLRAVAIAALMTVIDVIGRASQPGTWVLKETPDGSHLVPQDPDLHEDGSGLIVYRFGAPLYFANANVFLEEIEKLVSDGPTSVRWFVLDAQAITDIDTTGAQTLRQALELLKGRGVTFAISRANEPTAGLLAHYHLMDLIGADRFYPTNRHALAAYRQEHGQPGPEAARIGLNEEHNL
jgi:high affinity sulfate transporter 1